MYGEEQYLLHNKQKQKLICKSIKFEEELLDKITAAANMENMNFSEFTKRALNNELERMNNKNNNIDMYNLAWNVKQRLIIIDHLIDDKKEICEMKKDVRKEINELWDILS